MHTIHSLAHRAPPATRSRVRWQPYNALASASSSASSSSSISSRSPSLAYLSTPATSVSPSSPAKQPTPLCETERLKAHSSMPQTPRDPSNPLRENKNKYANGLVDQAVKSLCEIWRPQDIPTVFLTSSRVTVGSCPEVPLLPQSCRRMSAVSQTSSPLSSASLLCSRAAQSTLQCEPDLPSSFGNRSNLVPIKGFVHEVLRRSRTSGSVLQTALCYLEAIRPKVPELSRQEQSGEGTQTRYDSDSRIVPATPAELAMEAQLSASNPDFAAGIRTNEDGMDTVRVSYDDIVCTATPSSTSSGDEDETSWSNKEKSTNKLLAPPSPLPSPLLCPRRAFLASLILASKFTQDKCYSNRAWAKLSGLPAREIGRCERALGDALDWRLWVGKTPPASQAASPSIANVHVPAANTRPVVRCKSENTLPVGNGPFLVRKDTVAASPVPRPARALRRASTLPADAFANREAPNRNEPFSAARGGGSVHYEATWIGEGHQLSFSNIAQQDQLMGSPELSQANSPSTPSSTYSSQQHSNSPFPPTPGLSYSPSSTESSCGDRTIQMSTFMDDNMAHDGVAVMYCGSEMGAVLGSPTLSGMAFEAALGSGFGVGSKSGPASTATWRWTEPADYASAVRTHVHGYSLGSGAAPPPPVPLGYPVANAVAICE
ncbi:hypothetical protein GGX14DRAFT_438430 [Mycena pura]|uniref:Uncharacterized protein n=1 Tax=Mycena pura TaxID=153505 RepID=A0AAD6YHI9_9AGAR|nr:hypothetical protein GGX14DRAFT_438430 [Mycena pura]